MKFLGIFAAILLGVVGYANSAEFEKCPARPDKPNFQCFVNPCDKNMCVSGKICCSNYTEGCNYDCYNCPRAPSQPICIKSPCEGNPCGAGESCCPDASKPCRHRCFPSE